MEKPNGKDIVDDKIYSSQPIKKSPSWVPKKWRRLSLKKHEGSSSTSKELVAAEETEPVIEEHKDNIRHFIFRNNESYKWSKDSVEFYNNGDAPFCYCRFLGLNKLDSDFWGTLLGHRGDGRLTSLHIEGWVNRMMLTRLSAFRKNGPDGLHWTILPPTFRSDLVTGDNTFGAKYANGTHSPYPPFWEVKYVYIPLYVTKIDEWLLGRINLHTMEMTQYWSNVKYSCNYRELIHLPLLESIPIFFQFLLEEIKYWQHYNGPYIRPEDRSLNVHVVSSEYMPKDEDDLGGESGVLVCMLMEYLVKNKVVDMQGDFKDKCTKFRLRMANQLYNTRFSHV